MVKHGPHDFYGFFCAGSGKIEKDKRCPYKTQQKNWEGSIILIDFDISKDLPGLLFQVKEKRFPQIRDRF